MNHPCHLCGAAFKQIAKLKSHLILHEEEKTYKCQFCDKLFSKSSNLCSHIRTHTGEKPFQCLVCSKYFPRMNTLRAHIVKQHQVSKKEADQLIVAHERINFKEDTGKIVKTKSPEKDGVGQDNGTKVVEQGTSVRDTEFYTIHTDIVSYSEGVSESADSLTKRVYYKCKTCSKSMSHKSNMEDHVRSHSGIKLFQCTLCGKGLSRKQNLVHHLKHVHFIENSKIDQNIVRLNSPQKGKKIKRNVFKSLEVEKSKNAFKTDEISVTQKCDACPNDNVSCMEVGNEGEKQFEVEPREVIRFIPKTDSFDLHGQTDTKSEETIKCEMNGEKKESDSKHLQSLTPECHPIAERDEKTEDDEKTEQCQSEKVIASQPSDSTPDIFSKLDEFCLKINNQLKSDPEKDGVENDSHLKIDESLAEEDEANEIIEGTELQNDNLDSDQKYIVLNKDNPSLRTYKCKLCDFECKRRYYMAEEHILKHSNYKPYLCVVCCKPYRRKYTLRCHLSKEHKIDGAELDEIMVATGSKVSTSLPSAFPSNLNTSSTSHTDNQSEFANSLDPDQMPRNTVFDQDPNCLTQEDHINSVSNDKTKGNKSNKIASSKYLEKEKEQTTVKDVNINKSPVHDEISGVKPSQSKKKPMYISDPPIAISDGESPPRKKRKMTEDAKTVDGADMSPDIPKSLINEPGSLPSFFTSVYNMINSRQPKRAYQFNDKLSEFMDLKNMVCTKCNKKCSNKSNLKQHVRFIHLNFKEFACYVCGKKFNTKFNLKVHWKQHSDLCDRNLKEDFTCKKCGKTFTTKSYLKVHIVNKHGVSQSSVQPHLDSTENTSMNLSNSEDNNIDPNHEDSTALTQDCSENTTMDPNHGESTTLTQDCSENTTIDPNHGESTCITLTQDYSENTSIDPKSQNCSDNTKTEIHVITSPVKFLGITHDVDCENDTNSNSDCSENSSATISYPDSFSPEDDYTEHTNLKEESTECTNLNTDCSENTNLTSISIA